MSSPKIFDLMKKNILKACLTNDNTMLTSEENYSVKEIPLSEVLKIGKKLSFSNNGIVIGEGVHHVKISAKVIATNPTINSLCGIRITKNSQELTSYFQSTVANWTFNTFMCTKETFEVQEGDVIKLAYYFNAVGQKITLRKYVESTFLEVEVVD